MDLARLFGKSADKNPTSDPAPEANSAVALLETDDDTAATTQTVRSTETVHSAEDPKLASLLQRIQQLTTAPEASRTPEVRPVTIVPSESESQSVSADVA